MKITNIQYERKITKEEKASLGAYSKETLRLEGVLSEGENVDLGIFTLMERVHMHLDVPFNSKVKDQILKAVKPAQGQTLTEKDTVPSPEKKERPESVEKAKEEMEKLQARKEEVIEDDKGSDEPAEEQPAEVKKPARKKAKSKDGKPAKKEEAKEEAKVEEPAGESYDRNNMNHKKAFADLADELAPDWREDNEVKKKVVEASKTMEGTLMYTKTGLSKKFVDELKGKLGA